MKNVFINEIDNLNQTQLAVLDLYMKICQAMVDKDADTLRKYMNVNIKMRHMTGVIQTLDEWINDILNGKLNYYNITLSNIEIEINQNSAILSTDSILDASVYGWSRNNWNMHPIMNFSLINNIWIRI